MHFTKVKSTEPLCCSLYNMTYYHHYYYPRQSNCKSNTSAKFDVDLKL